MEFIKIEIPNQRSTGTINYYSSGSSSGSTPLNYLPLLTQTTNLSGNNGVVKLPTVVGGLFGGVTGDTSNYLVSDNGWTFSTINTDGTFNNLMSLDSDGNLCVKGNVIAYASGSVTGSTGGSGLIQTVYNYSNLGGSFDNATLTDTFNAYTINQINTRLVTIENTNYLTGLNSTLVINALGYTPYNSTNPSGFITSSSLPTKTSQLTNDSAYLTAINSGMVTTALGYTPYNSTNPNGYITSSALSPYQLASTAINTSNIASQSVNNSILFNGHSFSDVFSSVPRFADNLNTNYTTTGTDYYDTGSIGTPTSYGVALNIKNNGINWNNQLAFGTDNNIYFRQAINTSDYTGAPFVRLYHTGNFTPSNYSLTSHTHDYATHRAEGTNFIDYSYAMYDAYRGGWRTSNDLYVAYAYNSGTARTVRQDFTGANQGDLLYSCIADNDYFRLRVGGTASNVGFVEIATADDGTEPIYVRQYTGLFSNLVRTAKLLDENGNTYFPGTIQASQFNGSGAGLTGTASSLSVGYATSAGAVAIYYSNDTDATFQMLWGSGNGVYGTGGIYCNPSTDTLYANQFKTNTFCGLVGDYAENGSTQKIIWTIGSSWATLANHYGLGYIYEPISGYGHSLYLADNGTRNILLSCSTGNAKFNGNILANGEVTAYSTSDKRLKKNIKPLVNSLDIINKINPVSYNWNNKAKELNSAKSDEKQYGVIAQELKKILPELTHQMYSDEKYMGVDYIQLIPHLIGAIQELTTEINKLKNSK